MSEKLLPLCFSHAGMQCEKHPQWKAVACWRLAGIFHKRLCAECVVQHTLPDEKVEA